MKLPQVTLCVLTLAACSSGGAKDGGPSSGTAGGSSAGSSGGGTTGGMGVRLPDAGPLTAAEICLAIWAGQQRVDLLEAMPLNQALEVTPGVYCPAPSTAQLAQLTQETNALAADVLTLAPPAGGWPDGSGPSVCDDPATAFSGLAPQIVASLSAGRASWNAAADSACAAGLLQSNDLLAYVYGDGGAFEGEAQTIGNTDGGGGPCTQILQGAVASGGACVYPFDCAAGLYCRSAGADGACGGSCSPLVAAGHPCGALDQCAGTLDCTAGICGGPDAGPGPSHAGAVGASCATDGDCQSCLICKEVGVTLVCSTSGLVGATCTSDFECGVPWLFCDPTQMTCAAAATFGQACTATASSYACLDGWCDGTVCQPISGDGGPCSNGVTSCAQGLYCMQPGAAPGSCTPLPTLGADCGSALGMSDDCAGTDVYCNGSICLPLPNAGAPCAFGSECATGDYCETVDAGFVCAPLQTLGNSCATVQCQAGLTCDTAGICAVPLPGEAVCTTDLQCQSGNCLSGFCATPCTSEPFGGCENQGISVVLGLGGALVWIDRRRRRRRA